MTNVLDITQHLPVKPALDVLLPLQIIKRLHQLGKLDNTGFGIAALALSRMQHNGEYRCTLTRQELVNIHIVIDGEPFACVCNPEVRELAVALFHVQAYCGLWNHTTPRRAGKVTSRYSHFTERAIMQNNDAMLSEMLQNTTPISFVWLPEHADELVNDVQTMVNHQLRMAKFADISLVPIP